MGVFLGCTLLIVASGCSDGDDGDAAVHDNGERHDDDYGTDLDDHDDYDLDVDLNIVDAGFCPRLPRGATHPRTRGTGMGGGPRGVAGLRTSRGSLRRGRRRTRRSTRRAQPTATRGPRTLGLPGDQGIYTVSVYFGSQAHAEQALTAFRARGVSGAVAEVRTYCGD